MDDHIWSCCELSVGGQSSLSVGDVLSNLIHSLCEGIHAVRVPSGTPGVFMLSAVMLTAIHAVR